MTATCISLKSVTKCLYLRLLQGSEKGQISMQLTTPYCFTVIMMTTALTACDVMDDLEKSLSASLNFLFLLSTFVLVVL